MRQRFSAAFEKRSSTHLSKREELRLVHDQADHPSTARLVRSEELSLCVQCALCIVSISIPVCSSRIFVLCQKPEYRSIHPWQCPFLSVNSKWPRARMYHDVGRVLQQLILSPRQSADVFDVIPPAFLHQGFVSLVVGSCEKPRFGLQESSVALRHRYLK